MPKDFTARWITLPGAAPDRQCFFYARKSWQITSLEKKVFIRISADCRYRLHLNGKFAASGPVRGSATLNFYDEWEISSFLKEGENEIFIEVYALMAENYLFNSLVPAVIAEIPGMLATDESFQVQKAACWKEDVPWYTVQSGKMEFCDFRIKPDDSWQQAVPVTDPRHLAKELRPRRLPPMNERIFFPADLPQIYEVSHSLPEDPHKIPPFLEEEEHFPLSPGKIQHREALLSAPSPGEECVIQPGPRGTGLIFDFNWEVSGRAELLIDAPAGTSLQIVYAETMVNDRLRTKFQLDYHFTDCFILDEGENLVTTAFNERGFRLLQLSIRNFDRPVTLRQVRGVDLRYPFARRGTFHCSDHLLNTVNEMCTETIGCCSEDVFTDCPWRERAFWANDLLVNNLASLSCFGAEAIHRHCFELLFSQKNEKGLIAAVIPQPFYQGPPLLFPATNLYTPLMLNDYLMYSGDRESVKRHLPDVLKILEAAWSLADEEGILRSSGETARWNFFDWSFESNGYGLNGARESMLSSLFIIAAKCFEKLAVYTDFSFDRALLRSRRQLTAANVEKRFVSPEKNRIVEEICTDGDPVLLSTQLAHALWLLTGESSPEKRQSFFEALDSSACLMPDYYLHYFWFQAAELGALSGAGLERIRKYWGRCAATGSPTLYEAGIHGFGAEAMNGSGSLCHAFGTIPVNFFQRAILGVAPLEPGFALFSFAPCLFDLEYARGKIPVPGGAISVALDRSRYELHIPLHCEAVLPDGTRLGTGKHKGMMELFEK